MRIGTKEDITGRSFNHFTVIKFYKQINGCRYWEARCRRCGGIKIVSTGDLNIGHLKSCGCLYHRMCSTPEYGAWSGMKRRCREYSQDRKDYFDRGIRVCEEWNHPRGFRAFLNHV